MWERKNERNCKDGERNVFEKNNDIELREMKVERIKDREEIKFDGSEQKKGIKVIFIA